MYPPQGMNATSTLRPSASSPCSVAGPSAITCPFRTRVPGRTIGFWLMQVLWFERWYLIRLMMSTLDAMPSSSSGLTTMRDASTDSTTPSRLATTVTPESRATTASMPVPTSGASVRSSGTAWRCMFEPISARLASSFSRNGISDAATDTSWFGDTSIISTSPGGTTTNSPALRDCTTSRV